MKSIPLPQEALCVVRASSPAYCATSHFSSSLHCVDQASHNMFVMEPQHLGCPQNHRPRVIYDFREVLWVLVNTVKIVLKE